MIHNNIKNVSISTRGIYWSHYSESNKVLVLTPQEQIDYITQIQTILKQPKNIKFGKAIHTDSLCSIPRFKLKEYITQNKLKRTSRQDQCDTIIVDKNNFNSTLAFFRHPNQMAYFFKDADLELTRKVMLEYFNSQQYLAAQYKEEIQKMTHNNICFTINDDVYESNTFPNASVKKLVNASKVERLWVDQLYRNKTIESMIGLLDFLKNNPNVNIIFDEDIMEVLNSDGIELDNEYIDTLNSMFESGQTDNIKLAVEMLSNVNLEKDSLTIALILNKYQHLFTHGSGVNPSSMSSFKSIDKYYRSRGINWKSDWRIFAGGLYSNYKNVPEHKLTIEKFILDNINAFLNSPSTSNKFIIDSIGLDLQ